MTSRIQYRVSSIENRVSRIQYPESIAQKNLIMQNKPNLLNAQILVNCVLTMDYVNIRLRGRFKNKANQTQFKANFNPNTPKTNPNKPNF